MLYYVVEAVTVHTPERLVSFSDYDTAAQYANNVWQSNPLSFWVGVVDQDEWFKSFA
jgi:hypothetical protein